MVRGVFVLGRLCRDLGVTPTTPIHRLTGAAQQCRACAGRDGQAMNQTNREGSKGFSTDHTLSELACNVYISEGRDRTIIDAIVDSLSNTGTDSSSKGVSIVGHVFIDSTYNRTGITLVGSTSSAIAQGAATVSAKALELIDLRKHHATHPRLGVVDHISCHPLVQDGNAMSHARGAARKIARLLGEEYGLPTYVYGTASYNGGETSLAEIRRRFGYFKPQTMHGTTQVWKGASLDAEHQAALRAHPPAFGPSVVRPEWGIACVGSVPWVVNHNVVLNTPDVAVAKDIARRVSERGGGLQAVQAMGLEVDDGVEVACNLLDSGVSDATQVDDFISRVGQQDFGVQVVRSYQTGKTIQELRRQLENAILQRER